MTHYIIQISLICLVCLHSSQNHEFSLSFNSGRLCAASNNVMTDMKQDNLAVVRLHDALWFQLPFDIFIVTPESRNIHIINKIYILGL